MAKYRKKPVIVEAEQFTGYMPLPFSPAAACCFDGIRWYVVTIQGVEVTIQPGEWIIREPDGQHYYPCADDVFRATYEPVAE